MNRYYKSKTCENFACRFLKWQNGYQIPRDKKLLRVSSLTGSADLKTRDTKCANRSPDASHLCYKNPSKNYDTSINLGQKLHQKPPPNISQIWHIITPQHKHKMSNKISIIWLNHHTYIYIIKNWHRDLCFMMCQTCRGTS